MELTLAFFQLLNFHLLSHLIQEILNSDEIEKRTLRRIQKAARQQQKQQEQKRLRIAQELQRHMEEVEVCAPFLAPVFNAFYP